MVDLLDLVLQGLGLVDDVIVAEHHEDEHQAGVLSVHYLTVMSALF